MPHLANRQRDQVTASDESQISPPPASAVAVASTSASHGGGRTVDAKRSASPRPLPAKAAASGVSPAASAAASSSDSGAAFAPAAGGSGCCCRRKDGEAADEDANYSGVQARRAGFATWAVALSLNDLRVLLFQWDLSSTISEDVTLWHPLADFDFEGWYVALWSYLVNPTASLLFIFNLVIIVPASVVMFLCIQEAEVRSYPGGGFIAPYIVKAQEFTTGSCQWARSHTIMGIMTYFFSIAMAIRTFAPRMFMLDGRMEGLWTSCVLLTTLNEVVYLLWLSVHLILAKWRTRGDGAVSDSTPDEIRWFLRVTGAFQKGLDARWEERVGPPDFSGVQARRSGFATWMALLSLNDSALMSSMESYDLHQVVGLSSIFALGCVLAIMGVQDQEVRSYPGGSSIAPVVLRIQNRIAGRCVFLGSHLFGAITMAYCILGMALRLYYPVTYSLDSLWKSCVMLSLVNEITHYIWLMPGFFTGVLSVKEEFGVVVPFFGDGALDRFMLKSSGECPVHEFNGLKARRAGFAGFVFFLTLNELRIISPRHLEPLSPAEYFRLCVVSFPILQSLHLLLYGAQEKEVRAYPFGGDSRHEFLQRFRDALNSRCPELASSVLQFMSVLAIIGSIYIRSQYTILGGFQAFEGYWRMCGWMLAANEFSNVAYAMYSRLSKFWTSLQAKQGNFSGVRARRAGFLTWATVLTLSDAYSLLTAGDMWRSSLSLIACGVSCLVAFVEIQEEEIRSYPFGDRLAELIASGQERVARSLPWVSSRVFCVSAAAGVLLFMAHRVFFPYVQLLDPLWKSCVLLMSIIEVTYFFGLGGRRVLDMLSSSEDDAYSGTQSRRAGLAFLAFILLASEVDMLADGWRLAVTVACLAPVVVVAVMGLQEDEVKHLPFVGTALLAPMQVLQEFFGGQGSWMSSGAFCSCASLATLFQMAVRFGLRLPKNEFTERLWASCMLLMVMNEAASVAMWMRRTASIEAEPS